MIRSLVLLSVTLSSWSCSVQQPLVVGWQFGNGSYSELLREEFGDSVVRSGVNYFVLPNAWSQVEPNGLSIQKDRVRYVVEVDGNREALEMAPTDCASLDSSVRAFHDELSLLVPYALDELNYDDPSYLDGPNYVVEVHGPKATLIVDPKGSLGGNFPLVKAAEAIKHALRECRDA